MLCLYDSFRSQHASTQAPPIPPFALSSVRTDLRSLSFRPLCGPIDIEGQWKDSSHTATTNQSKIQNKKEKKKKKKKERNEKKRNKKKTKKILRGHYLMLAGLLNFMVNPCSTTVFIALVPQFTDIQSMPCLVSSEYFSQLIIDRPRRFQQWLQRQHTVQIPIQMTTHLPV